GHRRSRSAHFASRRGERSALPAQRDDAAPLLFALLPPRDAPPGAAGPPVLAHARRRRRARAGPRGAPDPSFPRRVAPLFARRAVVWRVHFRRGPPGAVALALLAGRAGNAAGEPAPG